MKLLITLALLITLPAVESWGQTSEQLARRTKGSPTAPVTVYEMSDFQCPFCRRFTMETFASLERDYIATGKVRWVFVNFPLTSIHPNALPAAQFAACAARQDRFWPAHDIIFRNQDRWASLRNPAPYLMTLADSLKLDRNAIAKCLESSETLAEIRQDADGAQRSGAQSTPSFYVEGLMIAGAQPLALFRQVLDSALVRKGRR